MYTRFLRQLIRLTADRRGGVSVMLALMLVPLVAVMGLATETASWYFFQRAAQNAADAAALAAAANGNAAMCGTKLCYADNAKAVSTKYNFTDGLNNTSVTPDTIACPSDAKATCYRVTVTKDVPIFLARVVGFSGTSGVTVGGGPAQRISAVAIARARILTGYCIITLNHGGNSNTQTLTLNGTGNDLAGCDTFVNGSAKCNGSDGGNIRVSTTTGSNKKCGDSEVTGATAIADPFSGLASNIPTSACTSNGATTLSAVSAPNPLIVCNGDLTIPAGTTTLPAGQVIVIRNGNLKFASGAPTLKSSAMTIIFSGTAGNNSPGFVSGSGTLAFSAPSSGVWSGVAMYQDPAMTKISSPSYTGNSPAFQITGLLYLPYANLSFGGAINKDVKSCISIVANQLTASGGHFFSNTTSDCLSAGLVLPTSSSLMARQALVQ